MAGACNDNRESRGGPNDYYPYFSFVQPAYQMIAGREHLKLLDQAVTVPSAATKAISDACKEVGVVVSMGINERDGGTLYNTQLLFDADGAYPAAAQNDTHLPRAHGLGAGRWGRPARR